EPPRLAPPPFHARAAAPALEPARAQAVAELPAFAPARSAPPPSTGLPVPVVAGSYEFPPPELLDPPSPFSVPDHEAKIHSRALLLEKTLLEFGCQVRVVQIDTGPVITQFEIELEAGLRVAKINSVANDLAIALAVPSVRIVSPIPGKTTVGIEVPNDRRA